MQVIPSGLSLFLCGTKQAAGITFYECDWVDSAEQRLEPHVLGGALQFIADARAAVRAQQHLSCLVSLDQLPDRSLFRRVTRCWCTVRKASPAVEQSR